MARPSPRSVSGVLEGLTPILERERPDIVLVHGDTVTTFAAALAPFFCKIPVGHVEAGLRTRTATTRFPKRWTGGWQGSCPRCTLRRPSGREKTSWRRTSPPESIYLTGNTAIDALFSTLAHGYRFEDARLQEAVDSGRRLILMTPHRRENWGEPLRRVYQATRELLERHEDVEIVFPVHKNPVVRDLAYGMLGGHRRVDLVEPLATEIWCT